MFGYITPLKSELATADFALYRSFYCGMCKAIGKSYGQLPRFTTNYDVTFLGVLLFSYSGQAAEFSCKPCVLGPFKKKPSVNPNPLFDKIMAANIILSYHKAVDGLVDREGIKMRLAKKILKRPYKKAKLLVAEVDTICKAWYHKLRSLEKENCASIDRAADCFSNLLQEVVVSLLDKAPSPDFLSLCYNVGKFVYLSDALDDIDEDVQKNRYNPLLAHFKNYTTRTEFIQKNHAALTFMLASTVNRAIESFNNIAHELSGGEELLQNILYKGLRAKCEQLLNSENKLAKPRI